LNHRPLGYEPNGSLLSGIDSADVLPRLPAKTKRNGRYSARLLHVTAGRHVCLSRHRELSENRAAHFQGGPLPNELHVGVNDMGLLPGTSLHPNTKKRAGLFVTPTPKHLFQLRGWFSGLRAASGCGNSGIRPGRQSDKERKTGEYGLASNSNKRGLAQVGVNALL
jgi:hypothetical protein